MLYQLIGYHYNNPNDVNDWINYTFHHDHLNSVTPSPAMPTTEENSVRLKPHLQ